MDIIEAIHDKHLFRSLFKNLSSWASWMVFLKAVFALPMDEDELSLYRTATGRQNPPSHQLGEVWCPTGRRSGKSFIAALVAVFLACFRDYRPYLAKGEVAMILVIAADRQQAQIILRYVKSFLNANRMLRKMVVVEKSESIELKNATEIRIATSSYRSIRGYSAAAVVCDEIGFWRADADAANPAVEVLRAIRPSLASIPNSLLLCISSPWSRTGPLWEAFNRHHGRDDSEVLVWQASTVIMNPTISQKIIDRDMEADPQMGASEWMAEFRSDLETFLGIDQILACVIQGRFEIPFTLGKKYTAFCDPSGGRRDAATLAIAHLESDRVILDVARSWKAPHDPATVVREMAGILKSYQISRVTGDKYAGSWPSAEFSKNRISYESAPKDKSGLYLDFLPVVLSQRVELLDLKPLVHELRSLERRTRSASRDLVDHPPRGRDDLANACAGVCSMLGTKSLCGDSIIQYRI
jgi:hypothetical protein